MRSNFRVQVSAQLPSIVGPGQIHLSPTPDLGVHQIWSDSSPTIATPLPSLGGGLSGGRSDHGPFFPLTSSRNGVIAVQRPFPPRKFCGDGVPLDDSSRDENSQSRFVAHPVVYRRRATLIFPPVAKACSLIHLWRSLSRGNTSSAAIRLPIGPPRLLQIRD